MQVCLDKGRKTLKKRETRILKQKESICSMKEFKPHDRRDLASYCCTMVL